MDDRCQVTKGSAEVSVRQLLAVLQHQRPACDTRQSHTHQHSSPAVHAFCSDEAWDGSGTAHSMLKHEYSADSYTHEGRNQSQIQRAWRSWAPAVALRLQGAAEQAHLSCGH